MTLSPWKVRELLQRPAWFYLRVNGGRVPARFILENQEALLWPKAQDYQVHWRCPQCKAEREPNWAAVHVEVCTWFAPDGSGFCTFVHFTPQEAATLYAYLRLARPLSIVQVVSQLLEMPTPVNLHPDRLR